MSTAIFSRIIFFLKEQQKIVTIFSILRFKRVVKQPSTCPRNYFWKKCFLLEGSLTLENLLTSIKKLSVFWKKFQQCYQNCITRSRWSFRWESSRKFISVFHFFDSWAKKLKFRWKISQSVTTVYYVYTAKIPRKICVSRKLNILCFSRF